MAPLPLLFVAALFAVARIVEPLDCLSCANSSDTCITNKIVTCSNGQDRCINMVVQNSLTKGQELVVGSSSSCAVAAKSVSGSFMFDFGDKGSLNFTTKLCDVKECTASFSHVPLDNYLNGISCPKCYKPDATSCEDNGTVYCSGDFNKCAAINGKIIEGATNISFAAKGCARGSLSDLRNKLPITIVSDPYSYTLNGLSFREISSSVVSMGHVTLGLDSKDLVSQVALFFPCFLGIFAGKIFS
ncbi:hypothetical protein JD844_005766 [Phrynosoma platyrhinos]|uniref:UPAR/Ly6 domain-containing protein n=1 Tax=Phrynosoma platyrhinos TaxID=52577 RepID=A0ABQ7TNS6_PHRPL|nr:hypothetical protein JD844_005766 [Phrynosoma platyrhinos]